MDIQLEKCAMGDFEDYYFLKCDKENILWTGHSTAPDKDKLHHWFIEQLKRKDRLFFLTKSQNFPDDAIGYLYLDIVGINNDCVEISYGVHSKFTHKGIGTRIIKLAIDYCINNLKFVKSIIGWVVIDNINSVKCFKKVSFSETNETRKSFYEGFNRDVTIKKFIYEIQS